MANSRSVSEARIGGESGPLFDRAGKSERLVLTLVSLGEATLCEALTSPSETAILRIGAVETPDCLDVSVFPLRLVVRIFRRKVDWSSTECPHRTAWGLKLESCQVRHLSSIVLLESPAFALLLSIRRRRSGSAVSAFRDAPQSPGRLSIPLTGIGVSSRRICPVPKHYSP